MGPTGEKISEFGNSGSYRLTSRGATSDCKTVGADYGIYDTTTSSNADVNATNFKDPA
jgi:hypothetical protein